MFVVGAFVRRGRAVQEDQHDRHGAGGDEGPAGPDHLERGLPHGRQLPDFEEIAGMFACEGTFPNQDHLSRTDDDYVGWQYVAIHAYSVTLALTMAFSLGSLLTATAIRLEAKACFEGIMGDRGSRLPVIWQQVRRAVRQSEGGARRRAEAGDDAEGPVADREDCAASHGGRAREGALLFTGCILHPVAQTLLWLCVLCGVAACALLMSLIPKGHAHYPSNPMVTLAYSGTVGLGFLGSLIFGIWMRHSLGRRKRESEKARQARAEREEAEWRRLFERPERDEVLSPPR
ncbi:unnamed protein product [Prorocentrum cordatum]|uniref:Uncharacterized protein n=1 Tax=Prorocentrum cordatum TaxID=2364126 RepID=A0ABN9RLJ0_9DINO|nr:unnamed protein product [Polarella glacialis]